MLRNHLVNRKEKVLFWVGCLVRKSLLFECRLFGSHCIHYDANYIFLHKWSLIFEMAAMPLPCNGHLLCCVNILTVLLMFFNKFASCSIQNFNSNLFSIENGLALALNSYRMFSFIVSQIVFDLNIMSSNIIYVSREKEKRELAKTNFINQLGHF